MPGADHGEDTGQEGPGQDVVHRRAGEGQHADAGPVHAPLVEDAGQDREGGDRHGGAHEEGEVQPLDLLAVHDPVGLVEHAGDGQAEA